MKHFAILVGLLLFVAPVQAQIVTGPTLTMNPNGTVPLAGVVEFETALAARVELTITSGADSWTVSFPESAQQHYLPVLGLKPDRTYTVDIVLIPGGPAGTVFATTDPLPDDFPVIVTNVSNPEEMEPGYTLIDCFNRGRTDPRPTFTAIVDHAGEVVWYTTRCIVAGRRLVNGNLYYSTGPAGEVVQIDLLANEIRLPLAVPGLGLHHDMLRTPHGTWLSLSRENVDVDEFFTSETDPTAPKAPDTLRDDLVVEFLPDGSLRRQWLLTDMLTIERIGYDALNTIAGGRDWTHSNAAHYRLEDDSIIVSVRHQDAVIKFSRETGELDWILGTHQNWPNEFQQNLLAPVGSQFRWQYHQHAPMWTGDGTLLLFDNGNRRASPFDGITICPDDECFSRGVEFTVDEDLRTVEQVWEYGEHSAERVYAGFISDADWQPTTGNRLLTFGGVSWVDGVPSVDLGLGDLHLRVVEVTDEVVPTKVFELIAYDPEGLRLTSYRADRIPGLYPTEYVKPPNGVGDTLRVDLVSGLPDLDWGESPVDSAHSAADHYMVYESLAPDAGFAMTESTAHTTVTRENTNDRLVYYLIAAGNTAGRSADEPVTGGGVAAAGDPTAQPTERLQRSGDAAIETSQAIESWID